MVKKKNTINSSYTVAILFAFGVILITLVYATVRKNLDYQTRASERYPLSLQYPFGKAFNLSSNSNLRLNVGTGIQAPTLTIEAWFKAGSPSSPGPLFNKRYPATDVPTDYRSSFNTLLGYFESGNELNASILSLGSTDNTIMTHTRPLADGGWHHIAFIHKSTSPCMKLYIDGIWINEYGAGGIYGCGSIMDAGGPLLIGTKINSCTAYGCTYTSFNNLYIDELRISKINRYPANFTVLRVPFTSDANTLALLHFDGNMTDASNHFPDATFNYGVYVDSTIVVNPTPSLIPSPTLTPTNTPKPTLPPPSTCLLAGSTCNMKSAPLCCVGTCVYQYTDATGSYGICSTENTE